MNKKLIFFGLMFLIVLSSFAVADNKLIHFKNYVGSNSWSADQNIVDGDNSSASVGNIIYGSGVLYSYDFDDYVIAESSPISKVNLHLLIRNASSQNMILDTEINFSNWNLTLLNTTRVGLYPFNDSHLGVKIIVNGITVNDFNFYDSTTGQFIWFEAYLNVTYDTSPPIKSNLTNPNENQIITLNSSGVDVFFNWTDSKATYNVSIGKLISIYDIVSSTEDTSVTVILSSNNLTNGTYKAFINAYNSVGVNSSVSYTFGLCVNDWNGINTTCTSNLLTRYYVDDNNCPIEYNKPVNETLACDVGSSSGTGTVIVEDNSDYLLLIMWGFLIFLSILLISQNINMGWFILPLTLISFVMFSYNDLFEDNNLRIIILIFSMIFFAVSIFKFTTND